MDSRIPRDSLLQYKWELGHCGFPPAATRAIGVGKEVALEEHWVQLWVNTASYPMFSLELKWTSIVDSSMVSDCCSCGRCLHFVYPSQSTLCFQPRRVCSVETPQMLTVRIGRWAVIIRAKTWGGNACFCSLLVVLAKPSCGVSAVFSFWWLSFLGDIHGFLSLSSCHAKRDTTLFPTLDGFS